jgi:major outer membrane protein
MIPKLWTAAVAAVIVSLLSLGFAPALAEGLSYSDLEARLEALESEVNSQQVKLASTNTAISCPASSSSVCCKSSAWYLGYELTMLQPIISDREVTGSGNGFEDELGWGHRFVLGYDGGSGMGVRMRYWLYNHGHDFTNPAFGSVGIDMDVLDVEFTLEEHLRNWDLLVSGGLRYGHAGLSNPASSVIVLGPARAIFEGVGPTVSFEAVRGFGDRGLYLLGNFRAALLFGQNINRLGITNQNSEGETTTVLENQLGIGYEHNLDRTTLNLRIAWETQVWMNEGWGDDVYGFGSNLTFTGPSASVELRF